MTAPQNISLFESCNGSMQVNSALEGANNAPNHAVFFIRAHERGRNHILGGGQFFVGLFVPCVCDPYNFSSHPLPQIENGSVWLQKKDRRIDGRVPLPKPRSGQVSGYTPLSPKWRTVVFSIPPLCAVRSHCSGGAPGRMERDRPTEWIFTPDSFLIWGPCDLSPVHVLQSMGSGLCIGQQERGQMRCVKNFLIA